MEVSLSAAMNLGNVGGIKRQMPIPLALSISPSIVNNIGGQTVITQQGKLISF